MAKTHHGSSNDGANSARDFPAGPLDHILVVDLGEGRQIRVAFPPDRKPAREDVERVRSALTEIYHRLRNIKAQLKPDLINDTAEEIRSLLPPPRLAALMAELLFPYVTATYERQTQETADPESIKARLAPHIAVAIEEAKQQKHQDLYSALGEWFLAQLFLYQQLEIQWQVGMSVDSMSKTELATHLDDWWKTKSRTDLARLTWGLMAWSIEVFSYSFLKWLLPSVVSPRGLEWLVGKIDNPDWFVLDFTHEMIDQKRGEDAYNLLLALGCGERLLNSCYLEYVNGVQQRGWEHADRDPVRWLEAKTIRDRKRERIAEEQRARLRVPLSPAQDPHAGQESPRNGDSRAELVDPTALDTFREIEAHISWKWMAESVGLGPRNRTDELAYRMVHEKIKNPWISEAELAKRFKVPRQELERAKKRLGTKWRPRLRALHLRQSPRAGRDKRRSGTQHSQRRPPRPTKD